MTALGATGTHTGRYDQLLAVPEISNITLPQHEPHRAVRGLSAVAELVSDDRDACSGSAASSKATKAPDLAPCIIEKGL